MYCYASLLQGLNASIKMLICSFLCVLWRMYTLYLSEWMILSFLICGSSHLVRHRQLSTLRYKCLFVHFYVFSEECIYYLETNDSVNLWFITAGRHRQLSTMVWLHVNLWFMTPSNIVNFSTMIWLPVSLSFFFSIYLRTRDMQYFDELKWIWGVLW